MTYDILTARHEAAQAVIAVVLDRDGDLFPTEAVVRPDGTGSVSAPVPADQRSRYVALAGYLQDTIGGARTPDRAMAGARCDLAMLALDGDNSHATEQHLGPYSREDNRSRRNDGR